MEQTSATAYPNVLVLEYLRSSGQAGPNGKMKAAAAKAEELTALGYQQLVKFQKADGGFNWWGNEQAPNVVLTALGLQEFKHMAAVREVDPRILEKARGYLLRTQRPDGSWAATQELHGYNMSLGKSDLVATAYVTWSLLEAGERGAPVERAIAWLGQHVAAGSEDPYTLALTANALALHDPRSRLASRVLDQLAALRKPAAKPRAGAFIPALAQTVTYSSGEDAILETTALAAAAFTIARSHGALATELLAYVTSSRQASGAFGSTQATILSLRALLLAAGSTGQEGTTSVAVRLNGEDAGAFRITEEDADVTRILDLAHLTRPGKNHLELSVKGGGAALLQASALHYLPWPAKVPGTAGPLALEVRYDRVKARVGERIGVTAKVRYSGAHPTFMVLADLGLPPGMNLDGAALDRLVATGTIARWKQQGDRLHVFLDAVKPGAEVELPYGLVPRMELKAAAPDAAVYEYYTPGVKAVARPTTLEVAQG